MTKFVLLQNMLCLYNLRGLLLVFKDSIDYSYIWFDIVLFIALMFHFWIQYTIWIYIVAYNPKWSSKLSSFSFCTIHNKIPPYTVFY